MFANCAKISQQSQGCLIIIWRFHLKTCMCTDDTVAVHSSYLYVYRRHRSCPFFLLVCVQTTPWLSILLTCMCTDNTVAVHSSNLYVHRRHRSCPFLAHLSTKCSWWAIVVSGCPSSVVVRRALSVVRRASSFDVYTLEATFATQFWSNFVRMFVLTISRPSSNMGHVGSKTRSPGQILENSCLHSRGHICNSNLMKLCQNVCFDNI